MRVGQKIANARGFKGATGSNAIAHYQSSNATQKI